MSTAEQAGPEVYCCSRCRRPVTTENVVRIEAELARGAGPPGAQDGRTGFMLITHHCPCSPLVLSSRCYGSYAAFVALFGKGVTLPYESPFDAATVEDDDPLLQRWRWELEQTADVAEFMLWLDAGRH